MAKQNAEKVKRASQHPDRPGKDCQAPPGAYRPLVQRAQCEGKGDCVEVCPYDVFEVRKIEASDFESLSFFSRLKNRLHGGVTAYTPYWERCKACGLCVVACPERAISLVESDTVFGESN